jgi:hypothetical protein
VDFEGWKLDGCCLFSLMNSVDYGSRYGSLARVPVEGRWGVLLSAGRAPLRAADDR